MALTKEALEHYKEAAYLYCERIGQNPDERFDKPHATLRGVTDRGWMWHLAAEKLHDLSMMLTSMRDAGIRKEARGDSPPGGVLNG